MSMEKLLQDVKNRKVAIDSLSPAQRAELKQYVTNKNSPPVKPKGMGDLKVIERNMPEPKPAPRDFKFLPSVNAGVQEAPLYKPFDKVLEKVGIKKAFKSIDDALGIEAPTEPYKPEGWENVPYAVGRMIGEAPSVALAYATGGAGAAALTPEASTLIPSATQSLSQLATRGAGAGLTHSLFRQAVDPKPISEAIPEIALETAGFMVGDPAVNVVGKQVGKFLKPSSIDNINKLNLTKDSPVPSLNAEATPGRMDEFLAQRNASKAELPKPVIQDIPGIPEAKKINSGSVPIDERTFADVGSRKVKAYQWENPEVKPWIQAEAHRLMGELGDSVKGQKTAVQTADGTVFGGNKRFTSQPIARILDETKATYEEVADALQRIISDNGAENIALAKRIELVIDDNLSNGFKSIDGMDFPPDKSYLDVKSKLYGKTIEQEYVPSSEDIDLLPGIKRDGLLGEGSISAAKMRIPKKMESVGNGQKVRSLPISAMEADYLHPNAKAGLLMETYPGESGVYDAITNKETVDQARQIIESGNAQRYIKENPGTALSNTVALNLVKKANIEGRFDDAIDLIEEVAKTATSQGQAIQSLRLWSKMSPEGMQRLYAKTIAGANKKTGLNKLNVDERTMKEINDRMVEVEKLPDGREKDVATAQVLDLIASKVPPSLSSKIATLQTMAQLLNPKTAIRNVGGNLGFAGMENVSDIVGAVIDKPISLITGKRSKVMPNLMTQLRGGKEGFKLGLEDALKGIDTSGMNTKFDLPEGRVFRGGLLGKAETALNVELRATDRAFYKAAYDESLRNQMVAAKANKPTDEMINTARFDALYRTFQDDNGLSDLFQTLKRKLNFGKEFGIGDFIIKYPKTPANLLMRGIDYSPAGFVKTILEASKPLTGKTFNQKAFVESFSRSLVGSTALFGTGALLHKAGIITSRPPEDGDLAELQRQSGFGDYRINASALKRLVFGDGNTKPQKGDTIISYDWFQPQAIPLAIGADIDANKGKAEGVVGTLFNALGTGINAFADQPVVQGIQTLFSGGYGQIDKGILKVLEGVPASFVPTLLNQIKQLADNQRRETYEPDKGKEAINRVTSRVPGLAGKMPQKYGIIGQLLETYPDGGNSPANVFINPAFVNKYNPSDEVQRINDIYEQTGETGHIPRVMDKTIKVSGETFQLTGKEYSEYQRLSGQKTQEGFKRLSKNLRPEEAAKRMKDIISEANMNAKAEILKARGVRVIKKSSGLSLPKKREG